MRAGSIFDVPELAFMMSPNQNGSFGEFAETLRQELRNQGVPSPVHADGFPGLTPECVYALGSRDRPAI